MRRCSLTFMLLQTEEYFQIQDYFPSSAPRKRQLCYQKLFVFVCKMEKAVWRKLKGFLENKENSPSGELSHSGMKRNSGVNQPDFFLLFFFTKR